MQMTVRDALNSAMDEEMERDDKVWNFNPPLRFPSFVHQQNNS